MNKSDVEVLIKTKTEDFTIPKNLLIFEIEQGFLKEKNDRTYGALTHSEYEELYNTLFKIAALNNNKLDEFDALCLCELILLYKEDFLYDIIKFFYIKNANKIQEICEMNDIDEAKIEINKLCFTISKYLDDFINHNAKKTYTDISKIIKKKD